jgi:hypothetical protein
MFHPLAEDPSKLKEKDLDDKVLDLTKKYHIALRLGHGGIANQIAIIVHRVFVRHVLQAINLIIVQKPFHSHP